MAKKLATPVCDPNDPWMLFSIDSHYDRPNNNLVAWWREKPSLGVLALALGIDKMEKDEDIIYVVRIGQGEERVRNEARWRLVQMREGVTINER